MRDPDDRGGTALVVVDAQNDFLPGGSLAVRGGDRILPVLARLTRWARDRSLPVFLTRDWHPPHHVSFRERGGPWPSHAVRGTEGARFPGSLPIPRGSVIISKATDPDREAYSGFDGTPLERELRKRGITHLVVAGLATDYCVLRTVLDARERGFSVTVVRDAIRGVNRRPGDVFRALARMRRGGARLSRSATVLRTAPPSPSKKRPRSRDPRSQSGGSRAPSKGRRLRRRGNPAPLKIPREGERSVRIGSIPPL
jgi:nicotinamidase/pyrazinamidase